MKKNFLFTLLMAVSVLAFGQKLPFQGKLIESGTPVDGTRNFVFEINEVNWSETHSVVSVTNGLYFVVLGSINPLPDSLFYGVTEQSMTITVDGIALSPVTLFKPLASPFEGSELVVHNDEGTKVGEMYARTGTNKNGELRLYGANGNLNARLYGGGAGGNRGAFTIHGSNGSAKANMFIVENANATEGIGIFTALGNSGGAIQGGFKYWEGLEGSNRPFFTMEGNDVANKGLVWMEIEKNDTVESGKFLLNSNANEEMYVSPSRLTTKKNGTELATLSTQDWVGAGDAGIIQVNGPSGIPNFEMTAKSWENPELPWFKMVGTSWNDIVQISAANDSTEAGYMNIFSRDNREASFSPNGFRFSRNGQYWWDFATFNIVNNNNTGDAAYLSLRGPNFDNINIGARYFEGSADLPFMHFIGESNYLGVDVGISKNNEGQQFGWINLQSETGKNLYLSPDGLSIDKIGLNTVTENGGSSGEIYLWGENGSPNIHMGGQAWQNHDLGIFTVFTDKSNGKGWFYGGASIWANNDGNNAWGTMALYNDSIERILLDGLHGNLTLSGGENGSIQSYFKNYNGESESNYPSFKLTSHGSTFAFLSTDASNGVHRGRMGLESSDGESINVRPAGINLYKDDIGTAALKSKNDGSGPYGILNLSGPNTGNVFIGSQDNPDLPKIELYGSAGQPVLSISCTPPEEGEAGELFTKGSNGTNWVTYSGNGIFASGTLEVSTGIEVAGDLLANGSVLASSDFRLKKNIQSIGNNTLQKIESLKGVSYNWRVDEFPERNFSSDKQIGVIAQELEAQFPELVKTNADGYKSVNYNGFTAVLLEAVKELNAKVEKLEAENSQLKAELSASANNASEIEQLKSHMEALVKLVQGQQMSATVGETVSTPGLK